MSNDDKIKVLLEAVETQQASLGKKPRAAWRTNAVFKREGRSHLNINTVKDPLVLVGALAFLLESTACQQEAAERLGVQTKAFEWDGYTLEDWEEDFKLRIGIVQWQGRKAKLDITKKKLKSLITEETRTAMELDDIEKLLQL